MDDRKKTLVAVAIILGTVAMIVLGIGIFFSRSSIVSPVPGSGGSTIKIIFITPSATPQPAINNNEEKEDLDQIN